MSAPILSVPPASFAGVQLAVLVDIDASAVAPSVGPKAYARAMEYVLSGAVLRARWSPSANALLGTVRGSSGNHYTTTAHLPPGAGAARRFEWGECSCPVGFNCKHVAALVLSVTGSQPPPPAANPAPNQAPAAAASWQLSLDTLLHAGPPASAGGPGVVPLAVELTLAAGVTLPTGMMGRTRGRPSPAAPRLLARVVRPGRTGWVAGGLSWSRLGTLYYSSEYEAAHVRLLQELYAVYGARDGYPGYVHGEDRTIELSAFDSGRLWPLLDEADAIGLRLVHARHRLGALDRHRQAELCLDATAGRSGSLTVTPVIVVDGEPVEAVPVLFIGQQGHGLVYVDRADLPATAGVGAAGGQDALDGTGKDRTGKDRIGGDGTGGDREPGWTERLHRIDRDSWPLRLARLHRPAPPPLRDLALNLHRLDVPAADLPRFRDEYYPRLRLLATVISSDAAFVAPAVPDPSLELLASYGPGHDLELGWEWVYQYGETTLRAPLAPTADTAGYRDPEAERRVLDGLAGMDGLDGRLGELGLLGRDTGGGPVRLRGIDTMRFSTEVLPMLDGHPGLAVRLSGRPVDYREASDSLRIGVSTGEIAGEADWFDLGVTITVEGRAVPFTDVFVALSRGESHLLLADGAYFSLDKPELRTLRRLIEEARALQDQPDGPLRISRFQTGLWSELAELGVVDRQALAWQRQVEVLRALASVEPKPQPAGLAGQLRPYQADGFGWLAFLWEHGLGGILADDMGLGKTLQSLALVCHAKQADPAAAPFLIVAPTSVVANWAAETVRFAPHLSVVAISDTLRRSGRDLGELVAGADVVVTSYTLFRLDFDAYREAVWSGLVLDEAQFVKNHQSKAYQCARRLPAPFKIAVTGTPMENNLMELWSLLSITAPGLFPNPTRFRDYYARPIERGDRELLGQLRRRVKPLVKRRTKEQVAADLPAKQEQVLEVQLHPRHRAIYQRHLQRERQKVLGLIDDMDRNRFTILRSLTLLRQLSLHAGLVDSQHHDLPSAKIDALLEQLLEVIAGGHRALVFSQFTGFLDRVRASLDAAGVGYCYLDGKTRDRATVIGRFKSEPVPVFLISLKAGGFGLNLTEADYCFLLDPWWNPATEAQAVDRTHRIGQTRNVMVYRLIAAGTIEEKVMALKARKAELFASVMDDGNVFGATLDAEDIRGLFG